jgi:type I restriction enzyme, R subunit
MVNKDINLVAQNTQSTVVAQFTPSPRRSEHYQSEDALEKEFIKLNYKAQAYEYITDSQKKMISLVNLRKQIEKLNNYQFTDTEWKAFFWKRTCKSKSKHWRKNNDYPRRLY